MKLSTKGRYGLRALVDLAIHAQGEHISLFSIAERQNISEQYLEHVFSTLRKGNLVKSIKGPRGGYVLADHPSKIKVSTVLQVLEGTLSIVKDLQVEGEVAPNSIERCIRDNVWYKVDSAVTDILEGITLEDLAEESLRLDAENSIMYFI